MVNKRKVEWREERDLCFLFFNDAFAAFMSTYWDFGLHFVYGVHRHLTLDGDERNVFWFFCNAARGMFLEICCTCVSSGAERDGAMV